MAKVAELAKSISEIGLLNPPAVRFVDKMMINGAEEYNAAVLIVGHHRLLAMKRLGKESIECDVYNVDPLRAELMEIDENLQRAELSPAEEALHIKRRKEIWDEVQAEKVNETGRQNLAGSLSDGRRKGPQHEKKFATELAEVTGDASSGLRQKIARARELGTDLHKIAGTSLDKGVEMDALIKMKEPERKKIIERAAKGEQVSARPQPKQFQPKTDAERLAYDLHRWIGTNRTIEFSNRLRALSQTDFHAAIKRVVEA
jgi:ParB-like chromosome segregation protein Spo0J